MINSLSSFLNNANINSTITSTVDEIVDAHKELNTSTDVISTTEKENFYLSSKSQKIAAISKEFFSGDPLTFDDIDALKERVYQLGLVSKQEYSHLTNSEADSTDSKLDAEMSSQTLADFAGDLFQRLDHADDGIEEEG